MTLPPVLRQVQQSAFVQAAVIPAAAVFIATVYDCFGHDLSHVGMACLKTGASTALPVVVAYVVGAFQHSPGSASFKPDGTENAMVKAATQK
jgi:hypothetical protein